MTPITYPNANDIAHYEQHGWWISRSALSEELLDLLEFGIRRFYAGERDSYLPMSPPSDWTPNRGECLRQNDYVSLQIRELHEFLTVSPVAQIAGELSRTHEIRLFHDQLVHKPSVPSGRTSAVGFHTDRAYWQTCTSDSMLTAWIPLQDCDEHCGTLAVLDGSHMWPDVEQLVGFHTGDLTKPSEHYAARGYPVRRINVALKRGSASFHHCRLIHGSAANLSDRPRTAIALHFQDASNTYTPVRARDGAPAVHFNDTLCRRSSDGYPDYRDPVVCPLLWARV